MNAFSELPPLSAVVARHGLSAKKSLGQHFLLNEAITQRVARYAGRLDGVNAIEIGPGPGGLTRALLQSAAAKVYVVEKDERCIAIMQELAEASPERLVILHEDAMQIDLLAAVPAPRNIIANLPYNIGTELLLGWLEQIYQNPQSYRSLTLMFQKEVAERITAEPGSRDYGRLSVISQFLCECRYDMELPPGAFSPPPKVSSAVVTLTPREKPLADVPKPILEKVVAAAFGQRRKMLRSSLKSLGCDVEKLLFSAGIDGTLRAEKLDISELCRLAQAYQSVSMNSPSPS